MSQKHTLFRIESMECQTNVNTVSHCDTFETVTEMDSQKTHTTDVRTRMNVHVYVLLDNSYTILNEIIKLNEHTHVVIKSQLLLKSCYTRLS